MIRSIAATALALLFITWPAGLMAQGTGRSVAELDFSLASAPKDCLDSTYGVIGIQSPEAQEGKEADREAAGTKASAGVVAQDHTRTIRLKYRMTLPDTAKDMEIQDISINLPPVFHDHVSYELSCIGVSGKAILFRKFAPKLQNQNYEEPPVNLLPRDCFGRAGEVIIRAGDSRDASVIAEDLKDTVFRAVLWDTQATVTDPNALDLYLPQISYAPGDWVKFHAHAANASVPGTLDLIRLGRDATLWKRIEKIRLEPQKVTAYSYRDGLNWPMTAETTLPKDMKSGYYVAVLRQGTHQAWFPFIVRPKSGNKAPIAIIAATNTWNAYNRWGNGSFYINFIGDKCLATDYGRLISSKRPTSQPDPLEDVEYLDHLVRVEKFIPKWLEKNDLEYVVYSDDDLNTDPDILKNHPIAILPSHPEYYTDRMYDAFERHVARGSNILYLGGNAIYYRVSMRGDQTEKHENGRRHDLDGTFGGYWTTHQNHSQAALLGVEYDARDYSTYAPYRVKEADHPLFAGTGLANGDLFAFGASGHEMDVITQYSPENTALLAKGDNPKGYGGDMVLVEHPAGGKIFSVGSIIFAYGLVRDRHADKIVRNAIDMMLNDPKL